MKSHIDRILRIVAAILYFISGLSGWEQELFAQQTDSASQRTTLHWRDRIQPGVTRVELTDKGCDFIDRSKVPLVGEVPLRWGAWCGVVSKPAVWLSDGTWLCGDLKYAKGQLWISGKWLEDVVVPLESVRAIVLQPFSSLDEFRRRFDRWSSLDGTDDRVWLRSGEQVAGVAEMVGTEGVLLRLKATGKTLEFESDEVAAVVFSPALLGLIQTPTEGWEIGMSDGSLIRAKSWRIKERRLEFDGLSGDVFKSIDVAGRFSSEVRYLRKFGLKGITNATELRLAQYKAPPAGSLIEWKLGLDQDALGRSLVSNEGFVFRGIGMHSTSQAAFRWDGSAADFVAELAFVPSEARADRRLGDAVCKVLVAREGRLESLFERRLIRANSDRSVSLVKVDVTGAQLIVLLVEKGEFGTLGDHVQWLDARVIGKD